MKIRLAGTTKESVVDGPGIRYVIFTQGCLLKCPGCHNPETHDTDDGMLVEADEILTDIGACPHIDGVTFSGGEPFLQPEACFYIAEKVRTRYPHLNIVCYSGNTLEQLRMSPNRAVGDLLSLIDILIDGPYIERLRDLSLPFRGSSNQTIIKLREI